MHNEFEVLEKKCKKYRLKKILKIFIPLSFITIFGIVAVVYVPKSFEKEMILEIENKDINKNIKINRIEKEKIDVKVKKDIKDDRKIEKKLKTVEKKKRIEKVEKEKKEKVDKKISKKTKRLIKDVKYSLDIVDENLLDIFNKKITKKIIKKKKEVLEKDKEAISDKKDRKSKKDDFSISLSELNSIQQMKLFYKKEPKYILALKIAKLYFKKEQYANAILWSKKANMLDRKDDGAWILYAQSEYARGNRSRAIDILRMYLANANSNEADSLLLNWTQRR